MPEVTTSIEDRKKELIEKVISYNPLADISLIERTIAFSEKKHARQVRSSGEDYFVHPLETAIICAELNLDTETIVAALLHDIVEDTRVSVNEIERHFGNQIAMLVDGVTKLEKITFTGEEGQAENFRKMFVAMAKDIRVILIKLADRLHNMRTAGYLTQEKRLQKAKETLEIYAPLAHRLGIATVKAELEDLSFEVIEPRKYQMIRRLIEEAKIGRKDYLEGVIGTIRMELDRVGIEADITGRTKHIYSIYEKMKRKGKEFNELYDIMAIRITTHALKDCYGALGVVHSLWKPVPGRFKDFIAVPKFNLYQSLHTTVIGPEGKPLEIQIRTEDMHRVAEYGVAAHWRYKEGMKDTDKFEEQLSWLRQILELDIEVKDPKDFMKAFKMELLSDEVFVFSPKGDVFNLPRGSTPLDFAYAVHTEVGHRCIGARISGKIVPLDYKLQVGDQVEIITSKQMTGPSRDWLNIVHTSRAKNKIRAWFSKEAREDSIIKGKEDLIKVLKKNNLFGKVTLEAPYMKELAGEFNQRSIEDLFAVIGSGNVSPKQVVTRLVKKISESAEIEKEEEIIKPKQPEREKVEKAGPKSVIRVKGVSDILIRFARCCNPVPGDRIVGYVTRGRGVSIHRKDCPNVRDLEKTPECFVEVSWARRPSGTFFPVEIQVEAVDRTKLLRDITSVISDYGLNINTANLKTTAEGLAIFRFVFEVPDYKMLTGIISEIKRIDSVFDAYRV